jgi:hypothetical protein
MNVLLIIKKLQVNRLVLKNDRSQNSGSTNLILLPFWIVFIKYPDLGIKARSFKAATAFAGKPV